MKLHLAAAVLSMGVLLAVPAAPARAAVNLGDKPKLEFVGVDGTNVSLAKLKGKMVVVDFWATWCGPCMQLADEMVKVNTTYSPKGLQMIGISLDSDKAALVKVAKEKGFAWPQYFDGMGWQNKVWATWGESGIPFTVLVGPDGDVLWKGHAAELGAQLEKAFKEHPVKLIDEKTMTTAAESLTKAEAALRDGDAPAAIKALADFPGGAKADAGMLERYDKAAKGLEASAEKMLADVEPLVEQKEFVQAIAKLKDLSASLSGSPVGAKAKQRLTAVMAMPEAKKALGDAAKNSKSAEALTTAQKLKTSGKHELAYPRFKAIAKDFAGTNAATTAAAEVATYEKDPAFVKRVMEQEAGVKAKGALSMARAYVKNGNTTQARAKYKSIIDEFPGTSFAKTADEEMKAIK